jgi:hypothetical protein
MGQCSRTWRPPETAPLCTLPATLATFWLQALVCARGADFSNFARGVDRRPFCGGARGRCGVGAAPHFSTPGAKRPTFKVKYKQVFGAHLYPVHFIVDLTPKYPTFNSVY